MRQSILPFSVMLLSFAYVSCAHKEALVAPSHAQPCASCESAPPGPPADAMASLELTRALEARVSLLEQKVVSLSALEQKVAALEKRPAPPVMPTYKGARPGPKPQEKAYKIPLGDSPRMGPKNAPVNLVIWSDFQCPYCAKVDPLLYDLLKDPELKGNINVTFKHFPLSFHKDAKPASKAALAAREQGEEYFWKMSQEFFDDQRNITSENIIKWAKDIGLNVQKFKRDLEKNDEKYEDIIKEDMKLGQRTAKVRGTPSLFVNGWSLKNRSVEGVKALAKSKNLL